MRLSSRKLGDVDLPRRSVCLIPVLLDKELRLAEEAGESGSVLGLPLGTSSILGHLLGRLSRHRHRTALLVSGGGPGAYAPCISSAEHASLRVITKAELPDIISACETSDCLMIVQPRYWPLMGHNFARLAHNGSRFRGATHAIALDLPASAVREQILCDSNGHVRRVHRLYEAMSWPEAASSRIICSLVPAHVLYGEDPSYPALLRSELATRGVLTQDVPICSAVYDLTEPSEILSLSEEVIQQTVGRSPPEGYSLRSPGVLVGSNCRIHPSARIVGPVIIQHDVTVEERVRIIGPAVLGAQAEVRRDTALSRSVLGFGATVPPKTAVVQQVLLARGQVVSSGSAAESHRQTHESSFVIRASEGKVSSSRLTSRGRTFQLALKRTIDAVGAGVGLMLLSPLLAVVALLIKLTSRGPVFFKHRREGKDGIEFPCIKFRSMIADAHLKQRDLYAQSQLDGPQFKMENDPRETRVGRWLRRTNIDELPQLFNVLWGHMSLVGPRPSPFRENQICVSWRQARLSVPPGITGLWQLCRDRRSEGDFHQWIYYDLAYVNNFSVWLDLRILLATFLTFGGRRRVPLSSLIRTSENGSTPATADRGDGSRLDD